MSEKIEQVVPLLLNFKLWTRRNESGADRVEGLPLEVCRYGKDSDDIIVVKRFGGHVHEADALYWIIERERGRAALEEKP